MSKRDLDRLIDANLNRLREGLRVLEDVARYIYDHREFSSILKELRHSLQIVYRVDRVKARDILGDVLQKSIESELKRESLLDLIVANFSRVEESSRVLEEVFKLVEPELSATFKSIRYRIYNLEREFLGFATKNSTSNSKKSKG